eukprot:2321508-Rhodomonas_salina.1
MAKKERDRERQLLEASNNESKHWEETRRGEREKGEFTASWWQRQCSTGAAFVQHRPMTHKTEMQRCQRPPRSTQTITPPHPRAP